VNRNVAAAAATFELGGSYLVASIDAAAGSIAVVGAIKVQAT
jgi:hypothetical protein